MAQIVLDGVTKRYKDGTEGVREMSLTIEDGEFMILVGPSGCGKSTALRMIAGLEDITEGELVIGDRIVNDLDPGERDIAMVFQSYALYPHMSVRDNMGFSLKLAKMPKPDIAKRVEDAARILGLTEYLDRKPANLSGGQRQRVAMGRAIVRKPAAFLMDEPLSNLDAKLRVQTRAELSHLQARLGTTTVYVTHDQTEAMTLGDRVAVMRAGELQQVGTPMELYHEPVNLFVAGFIGSPAMNFLPVRIEGSHAQLPMFDFELGESVMADLRGAERVIAGVRPEQFREAGAAGTEGWVTFEVDIDLVEPMGAETVAYFTVEGEVHAGQLAELSRDRGGDEPVRTGDNHVVARLDADSRVQRRARAAFAIDPAKLLWFDADSGLRIGAASLAATVTP
ncbi:MAG: ugpC [Thermoleophilia bacterium]|nr:ugpC [Thermoleophilia bacterium]